YSEAACRSELHRLSLHDALPISVDAAEVHKRAVVGDVLDHAVDDGAFGQRLQQLGALFALRKLDHGTAGQHHVVAAAIQLDDLEDRKSTRLNSSHVKISYAVFCL